MIVELLARLWSVQDVLPPEGPDLIALVAHGATDARLTHGSENVARVARRLSIRYPKALVAFGTFTGNTAEGSVVEKKEKELKLPGSYYAGMVMSTIEECIMIKYALGDFQPKVIGLVTDAAHSRRARIIWRTFFPKSQILVCSVDLKTTIDSESPMTTYHSAWKVLLLQALPTPLYWWWARKGPEYLATKAHFHQPTTKSA